MSETSARPRSKFLTKPLSTAIALACLAPPGVALAQQDTTVEEVIVTGSVIQRTEGIAAGSTDSRSPHLDPVAILVQQCFTLPLQGCDYRFICPQ